MRLDGKTFETVRKALSATNGFLHDYEAQIFPGEGFEEPIIEHGKRTGISHYVLYASVDDRTLPLEHGIIPSLFEARDHSQCAYPLKGSAYLKRPLEVLAQYLPDNRHARAKWDIWMLRELGRDEGFIHDGFVMEILR